MSNNRPLTGRTVLIGSLAQQELIAELEIAGARVLSWPKLDLRAPESYGALDEALENLFGYDWLIFRNENAVTFFLSRFQKLGHEISELDSVRVCALGQEALQQLEQWRVHVDIVPDHSSTQHVFEAIETYAGGRAAIHGLNFLVPSAGPSRTSLQKALEDAGARADLASSYLTCSTNELYRISALLTGGAFDCVTFTSASEVLEFAQLFDVNDLGELLREVAVVCIDQETAQCAAKFGLAVNITPNAVGALGLAQAVASYFRR
ncbi:MAG: uroporphyrinogen methyltransferase / synthase [Blastocatellia bacterium]|nr:uroporphyrinogen methyltransferase / synthase [Blastocatellia bacterium]